VRVVVSAVRALLPKAFLLHEAQELGAREGHGQVELGEVAVQLAREG